MFHAALRRCALVLALVVVSLALPASANAAIVTWDGNADLDGGDGLTWGDALNWDNDAVPTLVDTVNLAGANVTVLAPAQAVAIQNGSMSLISTMQVSTLNLGPGTMSVSGPGQLVNGATTLLSGTIELNAANPLDAAGPLTVASGAKVIQNVSTTVTGSRDLVVAGEWILRGNGTFLEDDATADMSITATGTLAGEPSDAGTVHSLITLTNDGDVVARDPDGAGPADQGMFELRTEAGTSSSETILQADAGYELRATMGAWTLTDVNVLGAGFVRFDGSWGASTFTATGTTQVEGTLRLGSGATYRGTHALAGGGEFDWEAGTLGASGNTLTIADGFGVRVDSNNVVSGGPMTIENAGDWTIGNVSLEDTSGDMSFHNAADGSFTKEGDGNGVLLFNYFENDGAMTVVGDGDIDPARLDFGTITSSVAVVGDGVESGSYSATNTDATLGLDVGTRTWNGVTVTGAGTVTTNAIWGGARSITATGTTTVNGRLAHTAGTFSGTQTMTGGGSFAWSGGTLGTAGTTMTFADGFDVNVTAGGVFGNDVLFENSGDWTFGNGTVDDAAPTGASFHNTSFGTVTKTGDGITTVGINYWDNDGVVSAVGDGDTGALTWFDIPALGSIAATQESGAYDATGSDAILRLSLGERAWHDAEVTGTGRVEFTNDYAGCCGVFNRIIATGTTTIDGTLKLAGGHFRGTGALAGGGTFDYTSGTLGGAGDVLTVADDFDLAINVTAGFGVGVPDNFTIQNNGDITLGANASFNDPGYDCGDGAALWNNATGRILHANASPSWVTINDFRNDGIVDVNGGSIHLDTCNSIGIETGEYRANGLQGWNGGGQVAADPAQIEIARANGIRTWSGVEKSGSGNLRVTQAAGSSTMIVLDGANAVTVTDGQLIMVGGAQTEFQAAAGGGTIDTTGAGQLVLVEGWWRGANTITTAPGSNTVVRGNPGMMDVQVVNEGTWTFEVPDGTEYAIDEEASGDDDANFRNVGTLRMDATGPSATGSGAMGINGFYNEGTVELLDGVLRLTSEHGQPNTGDFTVQTGAILAINCGTWNTTATTNWTTVGTGRIDVGTDHWCPGQLKTIDPQASADLNLAGHMRLMGNAVVVPTTKLVGTGTLEIAGGVVDGTGTLTIGSAARLKVSNNWNPSQNVAFVNDGTIELVGGAVLEDRGGENVTLTNNGILLHTGGGNGCQCLNDFLNADDGIIQNDSGRFRIANERAGGGQDGGGTFISNGTGPADVLDFHCGLWKFDGATSLSGTGQIEFNSVCLDPTATVIDISASSAGNPIDTNDVMIDHVAPAKLEGSGAFGGDGTLNFGNGNVGTGTLTTVAPFTLQISTGGAKAMGTRTIVNGGTLRMIDDSDLDLSGNALVNTGTITHTLTGDSNIYGAQVTNDGTIESPVGTLRIDDSTNYATGTLTGGTWTTAGGTLRLADVPTNALTTIDANVDVSGMTGGIRDSGSVDVLTSLDHVLEDGAVAIRGGRTVTNSNALAIDGSVIVDGASLTAAGGAQVDGAAATLTLADESSTFVGAVDLADGILEGRGTVTGAVTQTGGTVRPGVGATDRRTLDLGSYDQDGGALALEVAGQTPGTYDVLEVAGATDLSGGTVTLDTAGYTPPTHNSSINVVTSASGTSDPDPAFIPVRFLSDHWTFTPAYTSGIVSLLTVDDTPPSGPTAVVSTSHTIGDPSNDTTVDFGWIPADDTPGTGLSGYSWEFTTADDTEPDTALEGSAGTTSVTGLVATGDPQDQDWWFHIKARDVAGNWTETQHFGPFRIDTTPPETTVLTGLSGGYTNDTTPEFTFESNEPTNATFECSDDNGGTWAPCTTPYTTGTLAEGSRTIAFRATDEAGNLETTPASRTFTVDTTAPGGTFSGGPTPGSWINVNDGTFEFTNFDTSGTQAATCRFDAVAFGACSGALEHDFTDLADGAHTIDVKLADAAGNETTISRAFSIDTVLPTPTFTAPALSYTGNPTELFEWTLPSGGSTNSATCKVNADAPVTCGTTTSHVVPTSAEGSYTLLVTVTDQAGNTASDSRTIAKDETDPTATLEDPTGLVNASWTGSTLVIGPDNAGSFTVNVTATDATSGVAAVSVEDLYTGGGTDRWTPAGVGTDVTATNDVFSITYSWTAGAVLDASTYDVTVTDEAGNVTTLVLPIQVDDTAPTAGSVSYAAATLAGDGSVSVDWTASADGSALRDDLVRQHKPLPSDGTCGADWTTATSTVLESPAATDPYEDDDLPADSCVRYVLRTIDAVGNASDATDADVVRVDASDPTFTVDTPGDGVATKNEVELAGSMADATGVTSIAAVVDGPDAGTTTGDANEGALNCMQMGPAAWGCDPWTPEAGDGTYTLTFTATDGVGNTTDVEHHVAWDTTGPTAAFASFAEGTNPLFQHVAGSRLWFNPAQAGSFTATLTASDPNNVMDATFVDPDGAGASLWTTADATIGSAPWTTTYTWAAGAADPTDATVVFRDDAANSSAAVTLDIEPDATAPTGTVSAPAGDLTGSVSVTGAATDSHSGLRSVVVSYGGPSSGSVCTVTSGFGSWSCSWDTSALANGSYTLTATTTDNVGNVTTSTATATVAHPVVTPRPSDPTPPPPTPPNPTTPPDTTPPTLTPKVAKSVAWAAALKSVLGSVLVNEQSTVTIKLFVQPKDAKRLGLGAQKKPFLIGTATVKGNGTVKFKVVPNKKGKAALNKLKAGANVVLSLESTAVDAAGNKVVKKSSVTIKRPKARPRR